MRRLLLLPLIAVVGCSRVAPVAEAPAELSGRVLAADRPLAGARVRLKATDHAATTDASGRFLLPRPGQPGRLTAWAARFLIGGLSADADPLDLRLDPLPAEDNAAYRWVDPAPNDDAPHNCANCHGEIYREWAASSHSQSAGGRHFRNLYEGTNWNGDAGVSWGLLNEHPNGAAVCASCHAPATADDDPAPFDLRELRGVAAKGVHCDYCHKIAAPGDGKIGLTFGRYDLQLLRPKDGQLFFGPLDDVDRGEDAFAPLYHESRYCASCHEGIVFGVHVYSTYSEWFDSPARREGKQCQDCHMKPTGKMTNIAPDHGGLERDPKTLGNHRFFDGSREDMLRGCLRLAVDESRIGDGIQVTVRVTAENVGHRVPTGFIDRHLILIVEAETADGSAVEGTEGPRLPASAGKSLVGKPGKVFAKLLKDADGRRPAPFWRADPDPVDNRLAPGRTDATTFLFPGSTEQVRVRVVYRRFWDEVVRAKGWPDRDEIVAEQTVRCSR
jgi:hypothetical protein